MCYVCLLNSLKTACYDDHFFSPDVYEGRKTSFLNLSKLSLLLRLIHVSLIVLSSANVLNISIGRLTKICYY